MEFIATNWKIIVSALIFLICYAVIISEKINRAIIALCGALLFIVLGIVNFHDSYTIHIHWQAIFLLLGMMLLVGVSSKSGIFEFVAIKTAQSAGGNPVKILIRLSILTAVGSAVIDNVTMVLLITPIIIGIANMLRISPIPFLITEILICNIGGAATLVGDPPNIMIGAAAEFSFNRFLIHLTPIILVTLVVIILYLKFYFAKHLRVEQQYKDELMAVNAADFISDMVLAKQSIFAFSVTLLGFFTHQFLGLEPAVIALIGAALLLLIGVRGHDFEEMLNSVEWVTILFFGGLFVLVGGLVDVGIISKLATGMIDITGGDVTLTSFIMLWGAGIASAFIDNIPLVATMIPLVQDMGVKLALSSVDISTLWWSLALGACLGGNGTLIASSANLVVADVASREGAPISFKDFLKVSIPVTLITLALANVYIYIVFIKLGFA